MVKKVHDLAVAGGDIGNMVQRCCWKVADQDVGPSQRFPSYILWNVANSHVYRIGALCPKEYDSHFV